MENILNKIDEFAYDYTVYFMASLLVISMIISLLLIGGINYIHRTKCLEGDMPRRWYDGICEEYKNNEWIKINPFGANTIYYNNASEKTK